MSTMSLEQVRDYLRSSKMAGMLDQTEMLADAIDAHLAAREAEAKAVAWVSPQSLRNLSGGQSTREWMWAENEDGDIPLYAAPVAKEAAAHAEQPRGERYDVARHNDWLERNAQPKPEQPRDHTLYTSEDSDAPDVIKDRNGDVVLGLCKVCGRAEIQLDEPCQPKPEQVVGAVVAACPKCGATSVEDAGTRCIPDSCGDSCPGCEDPIASAWDANPASTPRPAVAEPAEVTDEMVERALKILHGSRHPHPKDGQAWCDARDVLEMGAVLAAHPHTGYSAVPERITPYEAKQRGWLSGPKSFAAGWNACCDAMLAAAPEVDRA